MALGLENEYSGFATSSEKSSLTHQAVSGAGARPLPSSMLVLHSWYPHCRPVTWAGELRGVP